MLFESASPEEFEKIILLLSDNYEFSTLILKLEDVEFDFVRSARAKKIVAAADSCGGCVVEFKHRSIGELSKMLINGAKKRGCAFKNDAAKYMVETCGFDINTLVSELDKLCNYVNNGMIEIADIDKVCVKSVDASVYEYARQILNMNSSAAFNILSNLLYMRIEPMIILYTTATAFVDIARVDAAKKANKSNFDIASDFPYKNKGFLIDRAKNNLRRFDDNKLKLCMNEILNADKSLKSFSADSRVVLEQMTVKLIYIIASGDCIDTA